MRVTRLELCSFRNLVDDVFEPGLGLTVLHGPNGAGKTNLLEALYFALAARSFRTARDREMIGFGADLARVETMVEQPGQEVRFLASVSRSEGRRQLLDGHVADTATTLAHRPPLAVFAPDRLGLVKGPPGARRGHLDRLVAALWPPRASARRRYAGALAQRNALLARIRARHSSAATLDDWDAKLAQEAEPLIAARRDAVALLAAPFADAGRALGLAAEATIGYRPRAAAERAELTAELRARREADVRRGFSGHGPHLDEIEIEIDGRSARRYSSQGEQRLALLALLFAERAALLGTGRPAPLMLLDDVMSELDPGRRELLVEWLLGSGQSLVTATEPGQVPGAERVEVALRDGRLGAGVAA